MECLMGKSLLAIIVAVVVNRGSFGPSASRDSKSFAISNSSDNIILIWLVSMQILYTARLIEATTGSHDRNFGEFRGSFQMPLLQLVRSQASAKRSDNLQ
jgi:hypothetical protein